MRTCLGCGHDNRHTGDFCEACGEYLRWTPTAPDIAAADAAVQSVAPALGVHAEAVTRPEDRTSLKQPDSVRPPLVDAHADEPLVSPVEEAGTIHPHQSAVVVSLRRTGDDGSDKGEGRVSLEPGGRELLIATVRNQTGSADIYDLQVRGLPADWWTLSPVRVHLVPLGSGRGAYERNVELRLHPPKDAQTVNRVQPFELVAVSTAHAVDAGSASACLVIAPYEAVSSLRPPSPVAGRGKARLTQRISWRSLLGLALVVFAALVAWLLLRNKTTVPRVTTAESVFDAQRLLAGADLQLGSVAQVPAAGAEPGTLIRQSPEAGKKIKGGSAVNIEVAVGSETVKVPKVEGLTLAQAEIRLREVGLQLGGANRMPKAPDLQLVSGQGPAPESEAKRGSPVTVLFEESSVQATGAAENPQDGRNGTSIAVPNVVGRPTTEALQTIKAAGLTPRASAGFSTEFRQGVIFQQEPPAGEKVSPEREVAIFASVGSPRIVFDRDGDLFITEVDGPTEALAESRDVEEEPAWSPDGKLIAYRRGPSESGGGQIWLLDPNKPGSNRSFGEQGVNDGRPAFSPDGRGVAFIRESITSKDSDLCFKTDAMQTSSCILDRQTVLSRPAWSPDGRSILTVARKVGQGVPEVGLYSTQRPFSMQAGDWSALDLVTEDLHGERPANQVLHVAWSPDGKQVAFTANWGQEFFYLLVSPFEDGRLGEPRAFIKARGCEVAWRPDGLELALTVGEDDACPSRGSRGRGIVRVNPSKSTDQTPVSFPAKNPAWEPISLEN